MVTQKLFNTVAVVAGAMSSLLAAVFFMSGIILALGLGRYGAGLFLLCRR